MSTPVRYTYDTEFVDDGKTIELISIGIVCINDGREYYAVNADVNFVRIMRTQDGPYPWLRDNVVPHLPTQRYGGGYAQLRLDDSDPMVRRYKTIADEVKDFLTADGADPDDRQVRELWAYYASYDHVALAQLWGPMVNLPPGVPMFTRDIKDWCVRLGDPSLPRQQSAEHDALIDARHNVVKMNYLAELEEQGEMVTRFQ